VADIKGCRFDWLLGSLVFSVVAQVARAYRWRLQLLGLGVKAPVREMVRSIFGTYAVNLVFPRLGEFWRTGYIAQRRQVPFSTVLGSMVADRLSDTVTVGLLTLLAVVLASGAMSRFLVSTGVGARMSGILCSPWMIAGAVVAVVVVVAVVINRRSPRFQRLFGALRNMWCGFLSVRSMPRKWLFLLLTAVIWGSYFVEMWISFYALPETEAVVAISGVAAVFVTFIFGSVSMAVPSNGGIGPWQGAIVLALSGLYGLPAEKALAFATLALAAQTLLTILLGLYTFVGIALSNGKFGGKRQIRG